MVRGVPPFPYVRESLEKLAEYADIVIVSATATEALMREWSEHGLLPLVSAICGQEVGSKAQCIEKVKQSYEASHCLMIGDAPGDGQAAKKNGILFYCHGKQSICGKAVRRTDIGLVFKWSVCG